MDIGTLLTTISALASTVAIPYVVEWAKKHPTIPLNADKTSVVRLATAVLAVAVGALQAWLAGDLAVFDFQAAFDTLSAAVMTFAAANGVYHVAVKQPSAE